MLDGMLLPVDAVVAGDDGLGLFDVAVFQRVHGVLHGVGGVAGHGEDFLIQFPQGLVVRITGTHCGFDLLKKNNGERGWGA